MKTLFLKSTVILLVGVIAFLSTGCKKDDESPLQAEKDELYAIMDAFYLWYDKMPEVNTSLYSSPHALMDALMYKDLDRWSYITTKQQIAAYYDAGEYVGFGIGTAFDQDNNLWITFIFDDSPLQPSGADRGWRIVAIDGTTPTPSNIGSLFGPATDGVTKDFSFENHNGEPASYTAAKRTLAMNSIFADTTYQTSVGKIGYFVLNSFINPTVDELDMVFSNFMMQGVSNLVVDLRYNGGGLVSVATYLANLIAGQVANGQVLGQYVHNNKQSDRDIAFNIEQQANSLALDKLVFITTGNSASASELVINGLKPHMDIKLVGTKTYGKPTGMYVIESRVSDLVYVPVCFSILNANGEGDYYTGIPVDIEQIDDITRPFGDLNEASLSAAISHIEGSGVKSFFDYSKALTYPKFTGLQQEIGAW